MKSVLRTEILNHLNRLSESDKREMSLHIQNNLKIEMTGAAGTWVGYRAFKTEPQLDWSKVSNQVSWAFPVAQEGVLVFKKSPTVFVKSDLGFEEPVDGTTVELDEVSGFVIPALAYDRKGYRLGRGKAFYDKTLTDFKNKKIGVCFESSFVNELPFEQHDIQCETVITDKQIFRTVQTEGVRKWN